MKEKKPVFWQLVQDHDNDSADLYIFGDICRYPWESQGEKSSNSIVKALQEVSAKNITVHINSLGGDVAEGLAIHNTLKNAAAAGKNVTTVCDGFACSAASVVFMAGTSRVMHAASLLMIHNAWTIAIGNADELEKTADDLRTITQASVEAYKAVAKISEKEIKKLMDGETWILPADAVEYGFATEVIDAAEEDGTKQSAFDAIMRKLTAPEPEQPALDPEGLAQMVADRIAEKIAEPVASAVRQEIRREDLAEGNSNDPADNGWKAFFG